mgnify:CR=1 FL=1
MEESAKGSAKVKKLREGIPVKIGIVCYPTVGGSGVVATELGQMLAERGHEIHFISSSVPFRLRRLYANIFYHQVEINSYNVFQYPPYEIQLASKIAQVAEREQLDIVHAHYAIPHALCAIMGREISRKKFQIVTTLHGTDITVLGHDSNLAGAIRYAIERSDRVTAVSAALARETEEILGTGKSIQVIPNFVDERIYRKIDASYLRSEFDIKDDEKVVIHVSNFRAVKRVPDVVLTFEKISRKIPAKLLLVGDGPEMSAVARLVDQLHLRGRTLFLGKQQSLEELYSISDLMLLLSEKESFGLVLLEAMACGVPAIGTRIGGIPEVIEEGRTGFLCEVGDVETAARYALRLLSEPDLHQRLSEAGKKRVREQFASASIVTRYEKIYEEIRSQGWVEQ